jgi:hypothetical protein
MIFVLCVVGTYALSSRLFDLWTMLLFGVLGYVLRQYKFPVAPLVLGIVLGDLMEIKPAPGSGRVRRGSDALLYPPDCRLHLCADRHHRADASAFHEKPF